MPVALGVPARSPTVARVSPPGRVPADTVHVYPVPVPPDAVSVAVYGSLTVPPGRDVAVTANGVELEEVDDPPPQL